MRSCFRRLQLWSLLAGVLSLAAAPAYGQLFHRGRGASPPEYCPPAPTAESPSPPSTPTTPGTPPPPTSPSVDLSGDHSKAQGQRKGWEKAVQTYAVENPVPWRLLRHSMVSVGFMRPTASVGLSARSGGNCAGSTSVTAGLKATCVG